MKKLFAILAIAGVLVACNDSGKTEEGKTGDSSQNATQSAPPTTPDSTQTAPDSTHKADSTVKAVDTTKK